MDYLRYWSLREKPFGRDASCHFFAGAPQREAIARLECLVSGGISSGVLLSPGGCGMTTLLRHVSRTSGFGDCAVEMLLTGGEQDEAGAVHAGLARALGIHCRGNTMAEAVNAAIGASSRQSVRTIWLIDGCGSAAAEAARRLIDRHGMFSVVMGTRPEAAHRLSVTLGCCPLRIELTPLALDDTQEFVQQSLYFAGGSRELFSDTAIIRLHEISEGQLGIISSLAELALMVGAASDSQRITTEMVDAVGEQLVRAA